MKLFYLLFLVSVCQAGFDTQKYVKLGQNLKQHRTDDVTDRAKGQYGVAGGPKMSGATPVSSLNTPWIVSVIEVSPSLGMIKLGPGAIINSKFVLVSSKTSDNLIVANDVLLVSKSDTLGIYNTPDVLIRRAVEPIYNFDNDIGSRMGLILFCPRIYDAAYIARMPIAPTTYAPGTSMDIYTFVDGLVKATTVVGFSTDCAGYAPDYDENFAFCSTSTGTVRINSGDYSGALVVINGVFVGINVDRAYGGEFMINISKYLPWIQTQYDLFSYDE